MAKRTSKAASATRKTSSQSDTATPPAAPAGEPPKKPKHTSRFRNLAKQLKVPSAEQFRDSLVAPGMAGQDGKPAGKYKARKR